MYDFTLPTTKTKEIFTWFSTKLFVLIYVVPTVYTTLAIIFGSNSCTDAP